MTGTTMGSLSYMSPEQVKGEATDARSDLYSVGVSLYEMVTGQRPFLATSDYSIMAAHVRETPKPPVDLHPGLPAELNEIILMAIAKDPAGRFQTADAFRNALSSVPVSAAAPAPAIITGVLGAPTVDAVLPPAASLQTGPITNASGNISAPAQAPQEPKMAPYTSPVPVPPPAQSSGHRGLYMTLGALIVLAVLVAAGLYMPRSFKTHAKSPDPNTASENSMAESTANQSPATDTAPGQKHSGGPANSSSIGPASVGWYRAARRFSGQLECHATHEMPPAAAAMKASPGTGDASSRENRITFARGSSVARPMARRAKHPSPVKLATQPPASAGAADSAQLDELEKTVDQISNRAAAVNSSLERLQQQQAASGYGLRGDMVEKQASLKSNLFKAEEALQHGDVARTKKYADLASADADVLERFLGH